MCGFVFEAESVQNMGCWWSAPDPDWAPPQLRPAMSWWTRFEIQDGYPEDARRILASARRVTRQGVVFYQLPRKHAKLLCVGIAASPDDPRALLAAPLAAISVRPAVVWETVRPSSPGPKLTAM